MAAARYEEILSIGLRCRACTSRRKTPADTLKLLGLSTAAPVDESTTANTSDADLEKQLSILSTQTILLRDHKNNLEEEIRKLGTRTQHIRRRLIKSARLKYLPGAVVHFVSLLTKANRYFEFKEFASRKPGVKYASSAIELSQTFFHDDELRSRFPEMDRIEIIEAAHAIYMEQQYQEPEEDALLTSDHIYDLVFQAREKGYHMHRDPMRELKKIMESQPWLYDSSFCRENLPMEFSDESIQKACDKYESLVRLMHDKYKKAVGHKLRSPSSSRKRSFETGVMEEMSKKQK